MSTVWLRRLDVLFVIEVATRKVLRTPVQAPNASAYAERWIRTVRAECLNWLLIVGRRHLEQVSGSMSSTTTVTARTGALELHSPDLTVNLTLLGRQQRGAVHRRDRLGGPLYEYRGAA